VTHHPLFFFLREGSAPGNCVGQIFFVQLAVAFMGWSETQSEQNSHQSIIHWTPMMTQMWMNPNLVDVGFNLGDLYPRG
jgi:hypothetical protein